MRLAQQSVFVPPSSVMRRWHAQCRRSPLEAIRSFPPPKRWSVVGGVGRSRTFRPRGLRAGESVARHGPDEALHFGLVVVVVHAGADERVKSARGQMERGRAWRAG